MAFVIANRGKGLLAVLAATVAGSYASADILTGKYTVYNDSASTQEYSVTFTRDLTSPMGDCLAGGTISGSLVDLDGTGSFLTAVPGAAIYTALVDGQSVASLLTAPFSLSTDPFMAGSFGPVSFGAPVPSLSVGPVNNNFQIVLRFLLSSGDSASFNSNLVMQPVPAPGALAVAAASGLFTGRRRRRTGAVAASVVGALALGGTATADGPALTINLDVNGVATAIAPTGTATQALGIFQYNGNSSLSADHSLIFSLIGTDVAQAGRALMGGSLIYTNSSTETQLISLILRLPTLAGSMQTVVGGSVAGTFSANGDGGQMALIGDAANTSLWSAAIGANTWNLGTNWPGLQAGPFGSASITPMSFGLPGPSAPGPAIGAESRLNLSFRISAGDTVSFSTSFVAQPIPAPGGLALLFCGVVGLRRRRL